MEDIWNNHEFLLELIVNGGFVESEEEISEDQLSQLDAIKKNCVEIEKKALIETIKVFNEFYEEDHNKLDFMIASINLFPEENIFELYIELENGFESSKFLVVITTFEDFEFVGTSTVH